MDKSHQSATLGQPAPRLSPLACAHPPGCVGADSTLSLPESVVAAISLTSSFGSDSMATTMACRGT